jgi:hypothetical protein
MVLRSVLVLVFLAGQAANALAQTEPAPAQTVSDELEPRIVGRRGTTWIGFGGFLDKFSSTEDLFPANYTAQVDVCRFLTKRIAVRAGVVGSGTFGGEEQDDALSGSGAPAVHASGGVLYYFTPLKMASFYLGGEYWAQLTQRTSGDSGSVVGVAGIHAVVSSRASVFVQGGFGGRIARGDDEELLTRIVAQLGVRLKF